MSGLSPTAAGALVAPADGCLTLSTRQQYSDKLRARARPPPAARRPRPPAESICAETIALKWFHVRKGKDAVKAERAKCQEAISREPSSLRFIRILNNIEVPKHSWPCVGVRTVT
ncbi:hypothetical protein EVAR_78383_1 [Eumeta japonica]|uniref:Uncharacterized protein n=1 Tax=Eumeta variegata TaxID=151549 RepID=A0A4C1T625_EUMVA|nr:hypothetical protein EVAR_78383_1 [Eumeta japonica]